jgi:hypothetical protein
MRWIKDIVTAIAFIIAVLYLPTTVIILASILIGRHSTLSYPYRKQITHTAPDNPEKEPPKKMVNRTAVR